MLSFYSELFEDGSQPEVCRNTYIEGEVLEDGYCASQWENVENMERMIWNIGEKEGKANERTCRWSMEDIAVSSTQSPQIEITSEDDTTADIKEFVYWPLDDLKGVFKVKSMNVRSCV